MATKRVPPVDAGPEGGSLPDQIAVEQQTEITNRLLAAEAKAREYDNREVDQRYWLRWLAVVVALALIWGFWSILRHEAHYLLALRRAGAPAALLVAIIVAPIVSMTTIALALLVAAFRGYKDGDEILGANAASAGLQASGITK